MSISTCSTKSNPNISLSGSKVSNLKNSMNYQLLNSIALPSQILIYHCVVEQSKPKRFKSELNYKLSNSIDLPKSNPNVL